MGVRYSVSQAEIREYGTRLFEGAERALFEPPAAQIQGCGYLRTGSIHSPKRAELEH